jgi:hypothetical protein
LKQIDPSTKRKIHPSQLTPAKAVMVRDIDRVIKAQLNQYFPLFQPIIQGFDVKTFPCQ